MDLIQEIKLKKKKEKEKVWEVEQKKKSVVKISGCLIYHFNDTVNCVWTVFVEVY